MPYTYDHIHLKSADQPKAVAFYRDNLGAKVVDEAERAGRKVTTLQIGGVTILLSSGLNDPVLPGSADVHMGLEHFGLKTDNLDRDAKALKAKGVKFLQDVTQNRPGVKIAFIQAPDNVRIEILERS